MISYSLQQPGPALLDIFNQKGQLVRSYSRDHSSSGNFALSFDGRDFHGSALASGVYYYRLSAGKYIQHRKMVLSK
jgi:flagellar hook assembly protein FlgD